MRRHRCTRPRLRIRGTTEKWVLREAMRHVLPRSLYERQKFAFMAPPAHTDPAKRAQAHALVRRHLGTRAVHDAGLFDPAAIEAFLHSLAAPVDRVDASRRDIVLNHLLCMQLLHDQFVAGAGRPEVDG